MARAAEFREHIRRRIHRGGGSRLVAPFSSAPASSPACSCSASSPCWSSVPRGRLLRGRVRMGVQRARRSVGRALRQSRPGGDSVRARVRAAVLRRLRQHVCPHAGRHVCQNGSTPFRHFPPRRADLCRLPPSSARQQGAVPGPGARAALRARLRTGGARHLRDSVAGPGFDSVLTATLIGMPMKECSSTCRGVLQAVQ